MTIARSVLALTLLAAFAYPASAQNEQGRLTGIVMDTSKGILPGVTVTAESPALIGVQTAVSETDGRYRFPSLPPGRYTLTFELGGFQTTRRENIVLALGQTLNADIQLAVATLQETVTVTAESPVVDVSSTKIGSEFGAEKLATIPSATDLWATLGQAPGVRMRGFDVGGSHKSQQTSYESFGVRNQNRVITDGVDTTEGTGGAGIYQDFFAHEEVTVSAAGGDAALGIDQALCHDLFHAGKVLALQLRVHQTADRVRGKGVCGQGALVQHAGLQGLAQAHGCISRCRNGIGG